MCCKEALELVSRRLDEELPPEEEKKLAEHLVSCTECRTLALELSDLHEAVSGLSEPVPEGFADSVMARIRREGGVRDGGDRQQKRGLEKHWRVWGGLAAAVVLIAVGTSRLNLIGMGASGSTAAAPAASAEMAYTAAAEDQASAETGENDTSGAAADSGAERSYSMAAPAPEVSDIPSKSVITSDIISGYGVGAISGALLTAEEAGYLVLEAAIDETIAQYESVTKDESLSFVAKTENGVRYDLTYTGLSEDGSLYRYTLILQDGTEQSWSAAVDGSEVSRNW